MKHLFLSLLCLPFFFCARQPDNSEQQADLKSPGNSGRQDSLFWDGKNEMLRGVAIGNSVWSLNEYANIALNDSADYVRLRADGFNAARFYLSYKFFESDLNPYFYKQGGWDFLDKNLQWAEENGIKFILNMHVPQGGFQSNAEGGALWEVEENQNRLIALWREIAKRYANQTAIAAYDILNEPVVSKEKSQWQKLAQKIVNAIREVDSNHLILIERINGIIPSDYSNDSDMNFIFIEDPANKWGLTFHFYSPIEYTHQYASWVDAYRNTDGGRYPDESILQFSGEKWVGTTSNSPKVPAGNSDWTFYEGVWKTIADTSTANIGRPTLQCQEAGDGTVWFDSLVFEKKSPGGVVETIAKYNLPTSNEGWYFWMEKNGGNVIIGESSVGITKTISDANYATSRMFAALEQGYSYRVSGKMKGENVPQKAACRIRFDWNYAKNLSKRNKAFLENEVDSYLKIAHERNLPVYLGEFGVIEATFRDKGGLVWVSDMLDILKTRNISFAYHAWIDGSFGVKDRPELENLFRNKFFGRR
ncbi:MAG: glycoside hydrolase family 5 protein [Fibromonadales bacterium]|nr:glycoside hydrolase family 5 protein [Fibromonadales bacterium]